LTTYPDPKPIRAAADFTRDFVAIVPNFQLPSIGAMKPMCPGGARDLTGARVARFRQAGLAVMQILIGRSLAGDGPAPASIVTGDAALERSDLAPVWTDAPYSLLVALTPLRCHCALRFGTSEIFRLEAGDALAVYGSAIPYWVLLHDRGAADPMFLRFDYYLPGRTPDDRKATT